MKPCQTRGVASFLLVCLMHAPAAVLYVDLKSTNPAPPYSSLATASTNIQAAINTSSAPVGDTVLVAPGIYRESVNFNCKALWLTSASGPSNTIIFPPAGSSAITFGSGETSNSVVSGFTITNSGISVASSSPTILSNILINCGTGIDCEFASPYILDNLISGGSGNGIYLGGADTVFIAGNIIQNNAGGIGMWAAGSPTIINNVIRNNRGTAIGMVNQCDANIVQNLILNNSGDGINALVPSGTRGPWAINNTISGNSGNGINEYGFVSACVIMNNTVVGNPALNLGPWYNGAPPVVQFNNFFATNGGVYTVGYYTNLSNINGNISADPLFVSAATGDFHLTAGSPCINVGTNGAPLVPALDYDGYTRIIDGITNGSAIVDMGAYEFHSASFITLQAQPLSQTLVGGQSAVLSVAAISPLTLTYQWQLNSTNLPGATNASLGISNVQSNQAGVYNVVIANAVTSVVSSNAMLTVLYPPPNILSQPGSLALIVGSNATFSCVATGCFAMHFQWQRNGTNLANGGRISGVTSSNLNLTAVITNDDGNYQVIVADNYNSVTSSPAALIVWQAPVILVPPPDVVASVFGSGAISVTATGAPPIYLQWQKSGINLTDGGTLSGAGSPTLIISNLQYADAGRYDVVVSNVSGTTTSGSCLLTVLPIVLWGNDYDPLPATATNVTAVSAGGDAGWGEFNLVLRGDGTPVAWGDGYAGSTNVPPAATNVVAVAAGDYHALALRRDGTVVGWGENSYGEATPPASATNVLAVAAGQWHSLALRQDGTIVGWGENSHGESTPPANATNVIAVAAGGDFSLALRQDGSVLGWGNNGYGQAAPPAGATNIVAIAAGENHGLALRADGTVIGWGYGGNGETNAPGNATNILEIAAGNGSSLALRRDGALIAWGYNYFGEINIPVNLTNVVAISAKEFHNVALVQGPLTPNLPFLWRQPADGTPNTGQTFILDPLATGSLPLNFQWYFNGAPLTGQTNNWLALVAISTNQAGNYQVVVTNNYGAVTSRVAVISELPAIAAQPASQAAFVGTSVTFTVTAVGIGPFSYQWYSNSIALADSARFSGSATGSLTISNLQMFDAGNYSLMVTNSAGAVASLPASLNVVGQPAGQLTLAGNTVTLSVTGVGPATLFYQWADNGTNLSNGGRISGATNSALVISGAQAADSGSYQVMATTTNSSIAATSSVATLTVMIAAGISSQPASQAALIGGMAMLSASVNGTYLGYQWFNNGLPLSDNGHFSGSTTPTLSVLNVQPNDAGGYVLFVSNALSSATSLIASLTPLSVPGPSVRYVNVSNANPVTPYLDWSTAATNIQDAIDAAVNGDSITVTDGVYQAGGRVVYGSLTNRVVINKAVTVLSVNGLAATVIRGNRVLGNNAVRCAYLTNNAVLTGFTLTGGATRTAGDTFKEESGGGAWCESTNARLIGCLMVSNVAWFYGGGECFGALSNCTLVGNAVTNGVPGYGGGAYFGVLNNCVLSNNLASAGGGGAYSNLLNHCFVIGNWATNRNAAGTYGGGADLCTLNYCIISNNVSASGYGGGVEASTLNNCLVCYNHASSGGGGGDASKFNNCTVTRNSTGFDAGSGLGGTQSGSARNSIIYYNNGANSYLTSLTNCCIMPIPASPASPSVSPGNFTNAPLFVDTNTDFHLQSNSPCINAGINANIANSTDLDGNPRIAGGTVDAGAYEFQTPVSLISYAWLLQYGLPISPNTDSADPDGDGMNNWQEWQAGTVPTNALSVLRLSSPVRNGSGLVVSWQSVNSRAYFIERSINLSAPGSFLTLATNIAGLPGTTSFTDTSAIGSGPFFYRVGIWTSAYQVRKAASLISFTWLQQYSLPTDGSADFVDTDGDGMNNWQEWIAGTDPTDPSSVLKMLAPASTNNPPGLVMNWQSVSTRTYYLQRSTNLGAQPAFTTLHSNIVGQAGTTSYTDTTATNAGPYFYRVGVQ
jgi:parallel beta-helix repeat protein